MTRQNMKRARLSNEKVKEMKRLSHPFFVCVEGVGPATLLINLQYKLDDIFHSGLFQNTERN